MSLINSTMNLISVIGSAAVKYILLGKYKSAYDPFTTTMPDTTTMTQFTTLKDSTSLMQYSIATSSLTTKATNDTTAI